MLKSIRHPSPKSPPDPPASSPAAATEARQQPHLTATLLGWLLLLGIALPGFLLAWRGVRAGSPLSVMNAAHLAGALGALAAAIVALWIAHRVKRMVDKNADGSADHQSSAAPWSPWPLLAGALMARSGFEFISFQTRGTLSPPLLTLANVLLLIWSVSLLAAMWAWIFSARPDVAIEDSEPTGEESAGGAARTAVLMGWDALLIGFALAAALWWIFRVPALAASSNGVRGVAGNGLWGLVNLGFVGASAALVVFGWLEGRRLSFGVAAVALLACWIGDAHLLSAHSRGGLSAWDIALRWMAPVALGAATLLWLSPRPISSQKSRVSNAQRDIIHMTRAILVVALPSAVLWAQAWRLMSPVSRATVLNLMASALWWGPILMLGLLARQIIAARLQPPRDWRGLRAQLGTLRRVVDRRTHQLSTLHGVTAELSDTMNCERILTTAIERTMAALGADSGAIWLSIDAVELASSGGTVNGAASNGGRAVAGNGSESSTRTVSNATFVWRELERTGVERRSLQTLQTNDGGQNQRIGGGATGVRDRRWSMVMARGHADEAARRALAELHRALETTGGLERFDGLSRPAPSTLRHDEWGNVLPSEYSPFAHVAAVRSKGELLGALGIARLSEKPADAFDPSERALIEALALEVGAALQNAQLFQEASRLADRDSLTDLLNHRTIQTQLNALISRAKRGGGELAVVMMDLSNFKFFNDTYGHAEGDRVLKTVAQCLREACRAGDIIGRFGGDEFIALLADTEIEGARRVCRRIIERVEEEGYQQSGDQRRIPIELAFGAALFPHDGQTALELLATAESQLTVAKHGDMPLLHRATAEDSAELRKLKEAGTGGSFGVLDALVTAIDNKDHYTRRHSEDVTHWAGLMARELTFTEETQRAVRIAGLLHDVGKIAVPDSVLRKPGRLNDDEFNIMQQHPVFGALIVKDVPNLPEVLGGIRHHHERFDGKGYPDKLAGHNIPVLGRLLAVPDCFSAMTTDRPYRKALSWNEALNEIDRGRGTQFDPEMADAFLEVMARIILERDGQPATNTRTGRNAQMESDVVPAPVAPNQQLLPRSVADVETPAVR